MLFRSSALLLVVCAFMALPAQAQLQFGVKGGVNVSKVKYDDGIFASDNMAGFFVGPMVDFTIPIIGLGVDGALLFSQRGIKANNSGVKQTGLDIPINLKYTIGLGNILGIFVAAGPDFYFDFQGGNKFYKKEKATVGINVGAGVKLIKHIQLGINYNIPLGKSGEVGFGEVVDRKSVV